jgi:hypothetical protein
LVGVLAGTNALLSFRVSVKRVRALSGRKRTMKRDVEADPIALASARITAQAENHLAQIEWRLARVGQAVALGHADRNMVADRIRAALVRANLNTKAQR